MTFTAKLSPMGEILSPTLQSPPVNTHKYDRGHAMIISGPKLRTGAARLSAQAALTIGAGLVSIVGDEEVLTEHAAQVTAIMLKLRDTAFSVINEHVRSIAFGPAAGIGEETRGAVFKLLALKLPIVLDADALSSFSDDPQILFSALHKNVILTPHEGEFRRLFPDIILDDRRNAAILAAKRSGSVILLKGAETIVGTPIGQTGVNRHSSPWLATAGSGDVLTGMVCGLLAQGITVFNAACIATWLHGDIGVRHGPGLTAELLIDNIPKTLQDCFSR